MIDAPSQITSMLKSILLLPFHIAQWLR